MNHYDVEAAVAGMVMREPSYLAEAVSRGVRAEQFRDRLCGKVFAACYEIWSEGLEVDLATVARKVGMEWLDDVQRIRGSAPITGNFTPYLDGLLAAAVHTELMARLTDITRTLQLRKAMDPLDVVVDRLVDLIGFCKGSGEALKTTPIAAEVDRALTLFEERMGLFKNGTISGVTTGFEMLDRVLNGFQPGFVYALGARTGVGKTTFAVNVSIGAAKRGHKVAFITVEMSGTDIVEKMLSREAVVPGSRLLAGALNEGDTRNMIDASRVIERLPILFTEVTKPTVDHLSFEILRLVKIEQVALIVVDYIQLFEVGDGRFRQPREEAKIVSARLKMLAKAHQVPLLVLSQLNRSAPEDGEPELIHIAESDQIARDSDVVMFLYRDRDEQHFLSIAKNRRGKCGAFPLKAELEYSKFEGEPDV